MYIGGGVDGQKCLNMGLNCILGIYKMELIQHIGTITGP